MQLLRTKRGLRKSKAEFFADLSDVFAWRLIGWSLSSFSYDGRISHDLRFIIRSLRLGWGRSLWIAVFVWCRWRGISLFLGDSSGWYTRRSFFWFCSRSRNGTRRNESIGFLFGNIWWCSRDRSGNIWWRLRRDSFNRRITSGWCRSFLSIRMGWQGPRSTLVVTAFDCETNRRWCTMRCLKK